MYWKLSIDLSRPLVASMGQHDPLDGLVTCAAAGGDRAAGAPQLARRDRRDFAAMIDPAALADRRSARPRRPAGRRVPRRAARRRRGGRRRWPARGARSRPRSSGCAHYAGQAGPAPARGGAAWRSASSGWRSALPALAAVPTWPAREQRDAARGARRGSSRYRAAARRASRRSGCTRRTATPRAGASTRTSTR